ncbi:hypothetical protein NEHOM01_1238 [Nematocida homosporus]|uniref:uncharacterized protein n=1 Tax=Nematocida homosporus TaxID=1912981 RepID=UPI00221F31EA|nr:uncharacterized protein NEHOM01_1238 [Nematocida homosporus]KAI5186035.1 hypothetical protein NEHOM01_1238 [Nematocida homosporus]
MQVCLSHLGAGSVSREQGRKLQRYLKGVLLQSNGLGRLLLERLEADGRSNCGRGSNRTISGGVENEICTMFGDGRFLSVALIPEGVQPIKVLDLALQMEDRPGFVRPLSLVYQPQLEQWQGNGLEYQVGGGHSSGRYSSGGSLSESCDTVGVIEVSATGITCWSSSGGPSQKVEGRIGPCSVYGANTLANEQLGVCISGTGESLIRSGICRKVAERISRHEFEEIKDDLVEFMAKESEFPYLGGVAICRKDKNSLFLIHFQTAESFIYGYLVNGLVHTQYHFQDRGVPYVSVSILS